MKIKLSGKPAGKLSAAVSELPKKQASSKPVKTLGWLMTSEDDQRNALNAQKLLSSSTRAPELFLKDGESKRIRFRDDGPIGLLWRYSLNVGGKWRQFTKPPEGSVDLFAPLGKRASLKAIYEVIDLDGYIDASGNEKKEIPRFLVANSRLHELLMQLKKRRGGLSGFTVELSRTGTRQNTAYMPIPDVPTPPKARWASLPRLKGDMPKYYSPLSEEEQELVISKVSHDDDGSED